MIKVMDFGGRQTELKLQAPLEHVLSKLFPFSNALILKVRSMDQQHPPHLELIRQNPRLHCKPTQSESVFYQHPQVIPMNIKI